MGSSSNDLLWKFQDINEYKFEKFVADLWKKMGWETEVTSKGDDGGIDIVARESKPVPQKQVIQVKRYSPDNSVGRPEVQQYSSLRQEEDDVDAVVIVTTGQFTDGAKQVAEKVNVKLVDGQELCQLIYEEGDEQLLESYLNGGGAQDPLNFDSPFKTNPSEGSQLMSPAGERVPAGEVPETIPGILELRKEILENISTVGRKFEEAEDAYNSQEFYVAFEEYLDVLRKVSELYQDIELYDAGLAQIDQDTREQLTAPEAFTSRVSRDLSGLENHYTETVWIAERARGLEVLSKDIGTKLTDVNRKRKSADNKKQKGETDEALAKYTEAKNLLEDIRDTVEIYEGLLDIYDERVVDTHQESIVDISYKGMKSIISAKIDEI